jgi:hypothetical protein
MRGPKDGTVASSGRGYGRATPLQMDMLNLGRQILSSGETAPPTDRDRLNAHGGRPPDADATNRTRLWIRFGGVHHFPLNDDKLSQEYTSDNAWKAVKERIDELLDDRDRLRRGRVSNSIRTLLRIAVTRQHFCLGGFLYLCVFFFLSTRRRL